MGSINTRCTTTVLSCSTAGRDVTITQRFQVRLSAMEIGRPEIGSPMITGSCSGAESCPVGMGAGANQRERLAVPS